MDAQARGRGQANDRIRLLESLFVHCRADERELERVDEVGLVHHVDVDGAQNHVQGRAQLRDQHQLQNRHERDELVDCHSE